MKHMSFSSARLGWKLGGGLFLLLFASLEAMAQAPIKTTFVSGSGRGGQEGPAMICDGQLSTKWCIDFPPQLPYTIILDAGGQTNIAE